MKKYSLLFFISVTLLPLSLQAAVTLERGVYHLEWTAENQGYTGLLVMVSSDQGKLRVKHYNESTESEEIVEMSMRMKKTAEGDALLGYEPIDPETGRRATYSADNFIFRRSTNGQWRVFNKDNQGIVAEVSFSKLSSHEESSALAEFGWTSGGKGRTGTDEGSRSWTALEWYNIAQALEGNGRYEKAIEAYNQVIQNPDPTQAICIACTWAHRGLCLERLGKNDEALLSYRKALKIKPDIPFAREGVARLIKEERL